MLDDGSVERRVRIVQPMETQSLPERLMVETHWVEAERETFAAAWAAEVAGVAPFTDSTLHMVAGLLLPIWKRLPADSTRVYRLQTDAGARLVGRRVSPAWAAAALATGGGITLSAEAAHAALLGGRTVLDLADGLQLRRVRVMSAHRIELLGFTEPTRERLRAQGLFSEIIAWRLRFFVPINAGGVTVLEELLKAHPLTRIADREAA